MHYTAEMARTKYPGAKIVFIGPCVGKRKEMVGNDLVDYMLTFEELDSILTGLSIEMHNQTTKAECAPMAGRGFARAGGIIAAVTQMYPHLNVKPIQVANLNKKNIGLLRAYSKGKAPGNFIEVMACEGGCISGPCGKVDYSQAQKTFRIAMGEE